MCREYLLSRPVPTCMASYFTRNTPRLNLRLSVFSYDHIVSPNRKTATAW